MLKNNDTSNIFVCNDSCPTLIDVSRELAAKDADVLTVLVETKVGTARTSVLIGSGKNLYVHVLIQQIIYGELPAFFSPPVSTYHEEKGNVLYTIGTNFETILYVIVPGFKCISL